MTPPRANDRRAPRPLPGPKGGPAPIPVHGFGLHVPEPHLEPRVEVLSVKLQRGHVAAATQLAEGGTRSCGERSGQGPAALLRQPSPPAPPSVRIHLEGADERHRSDGLPGTRQAGAEGEFHRLRPNNGPARAVVEQRPVCLLRAGGSLRGDRRGRGRSFRGWPPAWGTPHGAWAYYAFRVPVRALRFTCPVNKFAGRAGFYVFGF